MSQVTMSRAKSRSEKSSLLKTGLSKTGRLNRCIAGVATIAVLSLGAGCAQTHSIQGKVIQGNLSFVAVVDQGDERLKSEGLAGAEIEARADVGNVGGFLFGQAKTDEKGNFTLKFKEQNVFLKPVEFSATKDGFQPAKGQMNLPSNQRRLLIILTPGKPGGGGGASGTR